MCAACTLCDLAHTASQQVFLVMTDWVDEGHPTADGQQGALVKVPGCCAGRPGASGALRALRIDTRLTGGKCNCRPAGCAGMMVQDAQARQGLLGLITCSLEAICNG